MLEITRSGNKVIIYEYKDGIITIHNQYEDNVKIEFIVYEENFGGWVTKINKHNYTHINTETPFWKSKDIMITIAIDGYCFVLLFNGTTKVLDISKDTYSKLDSVKDPIIVTGHSGGGTSIIFKFLVHRGLYRGTDNGKFSIRKPLESNLFRGILNGMIDRKTPEEISANMEKYGDIVKNNISVYFNRFWGNARFDSVWGFKKPNLEHSSLILSHIFRESKFISVVRQQKGTYLTEEGQNFVRGEKWEIIDRQRPLVEGNPVFHLNYEKFLDDYNYANKVLEFCGLNLIVDKKDFNNTLKAIDYQKD